MRNSIITDAGVLLTSTVSAKASPFVMLNDTALDRLVEVSAGEPSVAAMVQNYRDSLETVTAFSEILRDECTYYEVACEAPLVTS